MCNEAGQDPLFHLAHHRGNIVFKERKEAQIELDPKRLISNRCSCIYIMMKASARCRRHARNCPRLSSRGISRIRCKTATQLLEGSGEALAMPITSWRLIFDDDGFFHETVELHDPSPPIISPSSSPCIILESRYDPCTCSLWQSDLNGGRHNIMTGDDAYDQALITTWVRTGQWTSQVQKGTLVMTTKEGETSMPSISIRLPGSQVKADLMIDVESKVPSRLSIQTHSGGMDVFEWPKWPQHCIHTLSTGQVSIYISEQDGGPVDHKETSPEDYEKGQQPEALINASSSTRSSAEIDIARAEGGQFLLRAKASSLTPSSQTAWFLLDTGCEASCITPLLASSLSLPPPFGSQKIHSLGEPLSSPMRRGVKINLGSYYEGQEERHAITLPLSDVYQEISLDGSIVAPTLTAGVSGVLGGSFLNRCLIEISAPKRSPGAKSPPKLTSRVYPSASCYELQHNKVPSLCWHKLYFIDSQPHVKATLFPYEGHEGLEGLFRLSLGVGGLGCLLSTKAARDLSFLDQSAPLMVQGGLMAGPGSSRSRFEPLKEGQVLSFRAHRMVMGGFEKDEGAGGAEQGFEFKSLRTIVHLSDSHGVRGLMEGIEVEGGSPAMHAPPDLALSLRASGMIGADAIRGMSLVLDYPNKRVAFISLVSEI